MAAQPTPALFEIIRNRQHVLLDFDGPVCSIFAGTPPASVADSLRTMLRQASIPIPAQAEDATDPLEVFRHVAAIGPDTAEVAQAILTKLEVRAVHSARPTPGSRTLMATAVASGRTVSIVSNNSSAAITAYLGDHRLTRFVTFVVGRDDPDPALMKPSPHLVQTALSQLAAKPGQAFLIGDSLADVIAAHFADIAVVGFANKIGKTAEMTNAGAEAVTTSLSTITAALASHRTPHTS